MSSLPRRFARLDEVQALWKPAVETEKQNNGVFGHLTSKEQMPTALNIPPVVMTWEKFERTILPAAQKIEYFVGYAPDSFTSLVTAVNADAPPILQWDREEARNPVSWYFWNGGSPASSFGLNAGKFHSVVALSRKPSEWGEGDFKHQGQGILFVIEGAKDTRTPGACLFPEILKSELHGIRSVVEAYSRREQLQGAEQASAAGVMLQKGSSWDARLRVTSAGQTLEYKLDRWD